MKPITDLTMPELRVELARAFGIRFFVSQQVRADIVPAAVAVDDTHPGFIEKVLKDGWIETQEPDEINWELLCDFDPTTSMDDAWALVTRHVIPAGDVIRMHCTIVEGEREFGANIALPHKLGIHQYAETMELALSRAILAWARENKS